ncbi:MAG: proline--tRNA ligase [Bdellovibrionales bacterium GWA2_49_15]|nr:MAG: proline--tRNA ligase [Bdellovibrionales bacterium GWA2_49_15]
MKLSQIRWQTYKDNPADAEIPSHQLMLRAGLIHKAGAGIYNLLPFGLKVVKKIEQIIREEHDKAGCLEVLMSVITPGELWQESGRWQAMGGEMVKMKDKGGRDLCISPTNEEAVTDIFRRLIKSYKDLPITYYQINTKFRDEIRPRFGLMRGREFIMKDAYSFHENKGCLEKTYFQLYNVYCSILNRIGADYKVVEADAGAMASSDQKTHEFQLLAKSGEDLLVFNESYAANIEKAKTKRVLSDFNLKGGAAEKVSTPNVGKIEEVCQLLGVQSHETLKTLALMGVKGSQTRPVLVVLLGDDELNETKVKNLLNADHVLPATEIELESLKCVKGFIGPFGHPEEMQTIFDSAVNLDAFYVVGANQKDFHLRNFSPKRDAKNFEIGDVRKTKDGDLALSNNLPVQITRGIEVGHIFQLGDKYTKAMGVTVLDKNGKAVVPLMGCYGIGVTRLAAAVIEQNNDEKGIIWPLAIAPFKVHAILIGRSEEFRNKALKIYDQLREHGIEILIDDRDVGPGFKFKDADLLGCPWQLTLGEREFGETGKFKLTSRKTGQMIESSPENLLAEIERVIK